jgi:quercetin dioxygenase-like cupin family protein
VSRDARWFRTASSSARRHRRSSTFTTAEIIYVLEGTLEYEIEGESRTVKAGEALTVPAEAVHSVKNVGDGDAAELATYIVETGKPLITLAE